MKQIMLFMFLVYSSILFSQQVKWTGKCHSQQRETYGVAYSHDGSFIISGSECHPASIRMWNATDGTLLWDYNVGNVLMCQSGVKMSANGSYVGSMEEAGNLIVLQTNGTSQPTLLYTINVGSGGSYSLDFSPDNLHVAVDGNNDKVKVYNVISQALEKTYTGHTGNVLSVVYSPDGSKILSGSADNTAKLWDTSGTVLYTFPNLNSDVVCVRFNTDGSQIYVAAKNGTIKVYDASTFSEISTITSPENLNQISISPDGEWLIAGCDTSARLFRTSNGNNIAVFNQPSGGKVYSVAFSPQALETVIGNSNGDVTVYSLSNVVSGIDNNAGFLEYSIYPNPTSGFLLLKGHAFEHATYEIFSTSGELLTSGITSLEIDITNLANGAYLVKVNDKNNFGIRSFIKN